MTEVRAHDFRRTETLDRPLLRTLDAALDTFARRGAVELSTFLRKPVQLSARGIQELKWLTVTEQLGERPYLATFTLEPLHGTAVLSFPLPVAARIIDFRLGGGSQQPYMGHIELTDTDFAVLGEVVTPMLVEFSRSISRVKEVAASLASQDSSIQFIQFAGLGEMFLVATFGLAMGKDEPVDVTFALPFTLMRQLGEAFRAGGPAETDGEKHVAESAVLEAPLDVWLSFPKIHLAPDEVAELKVGDAIKLFHPRHAPLELYAEGVLVARAEYLATGSKIVCSITEEVGASG